jgi:hypothetical protein
MRHKNNNVELGYKCLVLNYNPDLEFHVGKFRTSADDFCDEELILER